jgi:hypothetical protein
VRWLHSVGRLDDIEKRGKEAYIYVNAYTYICI